MLLHRQLLPRELLALLQPSVTVPSSSLSFLQPSLSIPSSLSFFRRISTVPSPPSPSTPKFKFHVSTAFHGKPVDPTPDPRAVKKLVQGFDVDSPIFKWKSAGLKGVTWDAGHDWYFLQRTSGASSEGAVQGTELHEGEGENVSLGIADGVGGWEESGVDPSHFSQAFMYYCREAVRKGEVKEGSPRDVMQKGYEGVTNEKGVLAGSSTALVATLDASTGLFKVANLGDSTFYIIRGGKVVHSQKSQTHFFNAPYQLEKLPTGPRDPSTGGLPDLPTDADLFQTSLESNDILLFTTDGFSDNVWPQELSQLAALVAQDRIKSTKDEIVEKIASACVNYARICSFKEDKESPFEAEARSHKLDFRGGKVDDVTVVAVLVSSV